MTTDSSDEPELGRASMWLLRAGSFAVFAILGWFLVDAVIG